MYNALAALPSCPCFSLVSSPAYLSGMFGRQGSVVCCQCGFWLDIPFWCFVFSHGGFVLWLMSWPLPPVCPEGLFTVKEAVSPFLYARVITKPRISLGCNNLYWGNIQRLWSVWMHWSRSQAFCYVIYN